MEWLGVIYKAVRASREKNSAISIFGRVMMRRTAAQDKHCLAVDAHWFASRRRTDGP
jgi:hypothetical protein